MSNSIKWLHTFLRKIMCVKIFKNKFKEKLIFITLVLLKICIFFWVFLFSFFFLTYENSYLQNIQIFSYYHNLFYLIRDLLIYTLSVVRIVMKHVVNVRFCMYAGRNRLIADETMITAKQPFKFSFLNSDMAI